MTAAFPTGLGTDIQFIESESFIFTLPMLPGLAFRLTNMQILYSCKMPFKYELHLPNSSWKQWKQCQTLFWGAPKSLQMVTAAMKLKDAYSLEGKL